MSIDSYDYDLGYCTGQRLANTNAYLTTREVAEQAITRWLRISRSIVVDRVEFRRGVMEGYRDQLSGVAQPLPPNDVPYNWKEANGG
jgi:hypothetical protein